MYIIYAHSGFETQRGYHQNLVVPQNGNDVSNKILKKNTVWILKVCVKYPRL